MRIFAAGISTETNTFSPIPTGMNDFQITREEDLISGRCQLRDIAPFGQWQQKSLARGDQFLFGMYAVAHPSGLTTGSTYECLRDDLLSCLMANSPVDVVLLNLHGAMVAEGYDDCEGDLITRIRQQVDPSVIIAVELDLHCHLSEAMVKSADVIITYKEYPHIDIAIRGNELFDIAVAARLGQCDPHMDFFDCKMVGMYPTSSLAMRRFISEMEAAEQGDDILSVSFAHGFPFGDGPDAGSKILVVSNNNTSLAKQLAKSLGMQIFDLRHHINFDSLSIEEAFSKAYSINSKPLNGEKIPVVIADQSDNAGGGAPSDSTFALRWLLDHGVQDAAIAIFYDPQVVKLAVVAGVGGRLRVRLGGKLGVTSGDPLDLEVMVTGIKKDYSHQFPQKEGKSILVPIGDVVALRCESIDIIVSSERCQCFSPCIFDDLGIDVTQKQFLVIKSMQHFYEAFAPIAREVIYMAGPGAVPPVVQQIPYQRMSTQDKYPWKDNPFL